MPTAARSQQLNQILARLSKGYTAHRPAIQRVLNAAFALYVLGATYRGLSARPTAPKKDKGKGKGKADPKDAAKAPKVAVRRICFAPSSGCSNKRFCTLGGRALLPAALGHFEDRDTELD
jgi:hypothetical protein